MFDNNSSDGGASETGQKPAKVVRHKRSSTKILKDWFDANLTHPYPTETDKSLLAERSGLTVRQVASWYTNARRRHPWRPNDTTVAIPPHASFSSLPSVPFNTATSTDLPMELMAPMDRWRSSPPDQEPSSWSAISQAVSNSSLDWHAESESCHDWSASSSASSDISHSSNGTWNSGSLGARYKHRRRRNPKSTRTGRFSSARTLGPDPRKIYQCTFCTDTFRSRYDWSRHEGTLHLVLERWICLPFGPRLSELHEGIVRCALCGSKEPSKSHLQSHNYQKCAARPISGRTFLRKDHLRQHLRTTHGVNHLLESMDAWKTKITRVNSRCGFCGERFQVWSDRNDHLVDHFRDGALMKDWQGCRGLDPGVALSVENAIPPYLIGQQSTDPEPFSASRAAGPVGTLEHEPPATPSKFELLTAELGQFVISQKGNGEDVTDEALRRKARLILYDDDDPWNHTPADNPEWLQMFKLGYGLPDLSSTQATGVVPLCAPFTTERMAQAAGSDYNVTPILLQNASDTTCPIPWQWQTPECLKEFSEMNSAALPVETLSFDPFDTTTLGGAAGVYDALGSFNDICDFSEDLDWAKVFENGTHGKTSRLAASDERSA